MIRYDMIWYDMIWYDTIWYDMIWYDMIWYGMVWYYMIYKAVPPARLAHKGEWNGMADDLDGPTSWVQVGHLQMPRAPCSRKTTWAPHACIKYVHTFFGYVLLIGTYLVCCFVRRAVIALCCPVLCCALRRGDCAVQCCAVLEVLQ